MRNPSAIVAAAVTLEQGERLSLLLLAMGLDAEVHRGPGRVCDVVVPFDQLPRAVELMAEEYPAGLGAPRPEPVDPLPNLLDAPTYWLGRGGATVLALVAACVAYHISIHGGAGGATRSGLLAAGAIAHHLLQRGELWRLLSAVFVHFDVRHLASNMGTMLVVAPPLAHMLGPQRFLGVFLATGVLANIASDLLAPTTGLKAGASGAIAGVLGALGGQALRPEGRPRRTKSWQVLGAMAAFYGMLIGFGPGRDNVAHVAGLVSGIAIGSLLQPPRPPGRSG